MTDNNSQPISNDNPFFRPASQPDPLSTNLSTQSLPVTPPTDVSSVPSTPEIQDPIATLASQDSLNTSVPDQTMVVNPTEGLESSIVNQSSNYEAVKTPVAEQSLTSNVATVGLEVNTLSSTISEEKSENPFENSAYTQSSSTGTVEPLVGGLDSQANEIQSEGEQINPLSSTNQVDSLNNSVSNIPISSSSGIGSMDVDPLTRVNNNNSIQATTYNPSVNNLGSAEIDSNSIPNATVQLQDVLPSQSGIANSAQVMPERTIPMQATSNGSENLLQNNELNKPVDPIPLAQTLEKSEDLVKQDVEVGMTPSTQFAENTLTGNATQLGEKLEVTPLAQELPKIETNNIPAVADTVSGPENAMPVKDNKMKSLVILLVVLVVGIIALIFGIILASTQ